MGGIPDSKVHGANMGPAWVLSAPDGPQVGPMNHAIGDAIAFSLHSLQTQTYPGSNKECWSYSINSAYYRV